MNDVLSVLHTAGRLTALDIGFARLVARLDGSVNSADVALAAALASRATGEGDVCVDLDEVAQTKHREGVGGDLATRDDWTHALRASTVVGHPGDLRPLILDPNGRLYLHRYWQYEHNVAEALLQRAARAAPDVDEGRLAAGLDRLFGKGPGPGPHWQKIAAATAVLRRLCVLSGGPGTGKTTTVVRILALLLQQAGDRLPRAALAAPTGKAAARVQEAIHDTRERLDVDDAVRAAIPDRASTLHRLLGARPGGGFRFDRDNPLPLDVLVVDEASMVDIALMAHLLDALSPDARLILVGDHNQLASVEAGAVLGDLCGSGPGFSVSFARRVNALCGESLPGVESVSPIQDCAVVLRHSYRFEAGGGIGLLAHAVAAGKAEDALEVLASYQDVELIDDDGTTFPMNNPMRLVEGLTPMLDAVRTGRSASDVLACLRRFAVLTPHRRGPSGVAAVNDRIVRYLERLGVLSTAQIAYPGRPVMIVRNDYELRLYNGDVGITLIDDDGMARVHFLSSQGVVRALSPARLPEHETVFALTVHKSQGSEYDDVLILLPNVSSNLLTRELLYTAITRARSRVTIYGRADVLTAAIERRSKRTSGLRDRLWPPPGSD